MQYDVPFSNTIPYSDPKYRHLYLTIAGKMTVDTDVAPASAASLSENTANLAIGRVISTYKDVSYKDLSGKTGEIVNAISSDLSVKGITLLSLCFDSFGPDEHSLKHIQNLDTAEKLGNDPAEAQRQLQAAMAAAQAQQASSPSAPAAAPATPAVAPAAPAAPAAPILMKFCTNCGTPANGTKFCTNCGSSLVRS